MIGARVYLWLQAKQKQHGVRMFLHDKSDLLKIKNALRFQLCVCSRDVNCVSGRLRAWTEGQQKLNMVIHT